MTRLETAIQFVIGHKTIPVSAKKRKGAFSKSKQTYEFAPSLISSITPADVYPVEYLQRLSVGPEVQELHSS